MSDWQYFMILLCLFGTGALSLRAGHQRVYHGLIREDAKANDVVTLDKPLYVRNMTGLFGDQICGYTLYVSKSKLPFVVVIKNPKKGHAEVVLAPGYSLRYEKRHRYTFELTGHDCKKGLRSTREKVHIEVQRVERVAGVPTAPTTTAATPVQHPNVVQITEPDHMAEVVEGQLFESIVHLRANGHACNFHIATPDVPFTINQKGVLRNKVPLDYSKKHNYIIEVNVDTCQPGSHNKPQKLIVNIKVLPICTVGWKDIPSSIDYVPESRTKLIAENAKLELCSADCKDPEIDAHITLTTKHIGKGCDRDTYSIQSQRKLCGASTGSVDLLPDAAARKPHGITKLSKDDGKESDQIYSFDGKTNVVEVPTSTFNHTLGSHFTISLWMKHEPNGQEAKKKHGKKEQILCNADGEKMSRHHYSLFIHNCKLIFLLRQEPLEGADMNVFKPAEWRWKLADVCDGQWHHYAVSIDFPQVRLYVDGKLHSEHNGEQTIDDWPLHKSSDIHFTRLVIGACYAGRSKKLTQFFHGYLAGVNMLKGKTESDRVIRCLNNCKEKLDFHGMRQMTSNMSVQFNSEMTEITLKGHNLTSLEAVFNRVGYINARVFPTPGYRALAFKTGVKCAGGTMVAVRDVNTKVLVLAREKPVITISGDGHVSCSEIQLARGHDIFRSVSVVSRTHQEAKEADSKDSKNSKDTKAMKMASKLFEVKTSEQVTVSKPETDKYSLDSCTVTAKTHLSKEEHLSVPTNLLHRLGLEHTAIADGVIITGVEKVANYETVLHEIKYANSKPQDINTRTFVVICSELNGRFTSNSFEVQLAVLHPSHEPVHVAQARVDTQKATVLQQVHDKATVNHHYIKSHSSTAVGTVVIVVICIGFLLAVIGIGVMRIRASHNQGREAGMDDKQEMEWDNSALTITVNPMEDQGAYDDSQDACLKCDDSDTDDDDSVCYHDDAESSEEEEVVKVKRDLEWDDSTLSF